MVGLIRKIRMMTKMNDFAISYHQDLVHRFPLFLLFWVSDYLFGLHLCEHLEALGHLFCPVSEAGVYGMLGFH